MAEGGTDVNYKEQNTESLDEGKPVVKKKKKFHLKKFIQKPLKRIGILFKMKRPKRPVPCSDEEEPIYSSIQQDAQKDEGLLHFVDNDSSSYRSTNSLTSTDYEKEETERKEFAMPVISKTTRASLEQGTQMQHDNQSSLDTMDPATQPSVRRVNKMCSKSTQCNFPYINENRCLGPVQGDSEWDSEQQERRIMTDNKNQSSRYQRNTETRPIIATGIDTDKTKPWEERPSAKRRGAARSTQIQDRIRSNEGHAMWRQPTRDSTPKRSIKVHTDSKYMKQKAFQNNNAMERINDIENALHHLRLLVENLKEEIVVNNKDEFLDGMKTEPKIITESNRKTQVVRPLNSVLTLDSYFNVQSPPQDALGEVGSRYDANRSSRQQSQVWNIGDQEANPPDMVLVTLKNNFGHDIMDPQGMRRNQRLQDVVLTVPPEVFTTDPEIELYGSYTLAQDGTDLPQFTPHYETQLNELGHEAENLLLYVLSGHYGGHWYYSQDGTFSVND